MVAGDVRLAWDMRCAASVHEFTKWRTDEPAISRKAAIVPREDLDSSFYISQI